MALDLSALTPAQQIAAIYIGYYDRAADPFGNDFWEAALANPSLSLNDIADDFATQAETLGIYPFLGDPTPEEAAAFVTEVYLNLFNREPDAEGLEFWRDALVDAIAGGVEVTPGTIVLAIIEGAQDVEGGTQDLTTILNKIEVSTEWTDAADAAGLNTESGYGDDPAAQASAKSIIEGVTDDGATVIAAKSTIADFFEPIGTPGETLSFTSGTDNLVGTDDDDMFEGYLQQNPFAGGVSNGLSSADRADGGAGNDKLYAELVSEFVGGVPGAENIDVQPRIQNIETLEFEARDIAQNAPLGFDIQDLAGNLLNDLGFAGLPGGIPIVGGVASEQLVANILDGWQRDIVVDAKNITGHDFLGSTFSDGDLMIENVTTLTAPGGAARNTSAITIGMDHTDNANSDGDASDLTVYFDEDYLISGQQAEGKIFYFLLDEDAELAGNPNRLNNIDVDGIRFTIDTGNGPVDVTIESPLANIGLTHQGFVNALQDPLQALIADGTLPAGTTLSLDPTVTDTTFIDDGSESAPIPAIVLTSGDGSEVIATGFSRIEDEIGEYDVYGRFTSQNEVADEPVSINIDLYKAGRGGEGGNLVIGGKDQSEVGNGIEVFHVNVKGDGPDAIVDQPSNIGTLTSTNNALREIYIKTDAMDAVKDSVASLTIRDGFNELYDGDSAIGAESGDLQLVNADAFLGDLALGTDQDVINLDMLTAQGGGDVWFYGTLNGVETDQAYSYTTGGGNDVVDLELDGDALDYNGSSVNVATGAGDDDINIDFQPDQPEDGNNQQLNQAILDNVQVDAGAGNDVVNVDGIGNAIINGGAGKDIIYTDGNSSSNAIWAVNFDNARADATLGGLGGSAADDLPGVQTSLAYVGGATVTVTLSGAGIRDLADGGGVMAFDDAEIGDDGYEASFTIGSLLNGRTHYGTQADVNAAIKAAIEGDDVLNALLTVVEGANNTLAIVSKTSGDFQPTDLRIDIAHRDATSDAIATSVLSEARTVFQDSSLTLNDLWGTTTFTTAAPGIYQAGAPAGEAGDLTSSVTANTWFDGLSVDGDVVSMNDNLHTAGTPSTAESDNVINGGSDDDIIVLSTDAVSGGTITYTPGGNNSMINGASNETIVMTGTFGNDTVMNFTTATPQAQTGFTELEVRVAELLDNTDGGVETVVTPGTPETFDLDVFAVPTVATSYTVAFGGVTAIIPAGADTDGVADAIAAAFATTNASGFTAVNNGGGVIRFTADDSGNVDPDVTVFDNFESTFSFETLAFIVDNVDGTDDVVAISEEVLVVEYFGTPSDLSVDDVISVTLNGTFGTVVIDVDSSDGLVPDMSAADLATLVRTVVVGKSGGTITATQLGGVVTYTAVDGSAGGDQDIDFTLDHFVTGSFPLADTVAQGLDFLDFGNYLTSLENSSVNSPAGPDSDVSNTLIDVTLDYNENNTLGGTGDGAANAEVEANEVAVVRMANVAGDTFDGLSAADVAALFNSSAAAADYGNLTAAGFDVIDNQSDNAVIDGDGKAIFMVEDGANLGHYKVFELSWDASAADGSEGVTASQIGSLDFGTSLTDLGDVNLVGSDDYAMLNDIGILNFV